MGVLINSCRCMVLEVTWTVFYEVTANPRLRTILHGIDVGFLLSCTNLMTIIWPRVIWAMFVEISSFSFLVPQLLRSVRQQAAPHLRRPNACESAAVMLCGIFWRSLSFIIPYLPINYLTYICIHIKYIHTRRRSLLLFFHI